MQEKLTDILDNLLGLLLLEGSYEVEETEESFLVSIQTQDAGRLIGFKGDSLDSLQLLINNILSRKLDEKEDFKRVVLDVEGWKKQKETDLTEKAREYADKVLETAESLELEPMPAWQRRIIHTAIGEIDGVESESAGDGRERHLVIRPQVNKS